MTDRQAPRRLTAALTATALGASTLLAVALPSTANAAPQPPSLAEVLADRTPDLAAVFDPQDRTIRPGERFTVSGRIATVGDGPTKLGDGVPASFRLEIVAPDGAVVASQDVKAGALGSFSTAVPGAATSALVAPGETVQLAARAVDVRHDDLRTADAGATAVTLTAPGGLEIANSFVSSVGWVKPGETYPSRVIVTNPGEDVDGAVVTVTAPRGTTFTGARSAAGTVDVTPTIVTWDLGLFAAGEEEPSTAILILEHKALTLAQEPTLVWRDLSTTATLQVGDEAQEVVAHGPRVIPPGAQYDTARFGDRPFPVVPVDYLDRKHQAEHTGQMLSDKINSPELPGSTYNLFQEMSLGQLFPNGTVPSSDIATAGFDYAPGFPFTKAAPQGTCHGVTAADSPAPALGSPVYPERIKDGFYQLPGTTDYYGDDRFGSAVAGSVTGVGALMDIDSACGPTGKLVADSAAIADPEIDYSDYDTDKDGLVDFFMVVFAGCGGNGGSQLAEPTGTLGCPYGDVSYDNVWPHSSSLEYYYSDPATGLPGIVTDDQLKDDEGNPLYYTDNTYTDMTTEVTEHKVFVRVGPYNVNPETAIDRASVISHEYGHSLGLPDFYSLGDRETYGDWNLMATDKSHHLDVFSKVEMGWVVPQVLSSDRTVENITDSKQDTHSITWQRPDGTPYTLTGENVHNSLAFVAKLPGRQLIDPAKFDTGDKASASHAWWSGSGNDFGCAPEAGRNLDLAIPGIENLPAGTKVTLEMSSLFDIEWDYDYGYVMTSTDGGENFAAQPSERDEPTTTSTNANQNACQAKYGNGITGSSASYTDQATVAVDRATSNYPDATFIKDSFDISELAGAEQPVLRFSYATDPGLARPGWFVDDVKVTATLPSGAQVLMQSDFETDGDPDDPRVFNGGCQGDLGDRCTLGWNYVDSSSEAPADHAYLLELRDRSGFDLDGRGENDRDPIGFQPGVSLIYTDEAHGYGNVGTDNPPAQSPLDAVPTPGSDTPNLDDAAWTDAAGRNRFSDSGAGHTDNYTDPGNNVVDPRYSKVTNPWRFQYDCLTFHVLSMSGQGNGPETADGDLTGTVAFDLGEGCGEFDYGHAKQIPAPPENQAPEAAVTATPASVETGEEVSFDATASTDAETPDDLDYSWDFGDGGSTKDATGPLATRTFAEAGTYTVTVTVTDPRGATDTATVDVTVSAQPVEPVNERPYAEASADPTETHIKGLVNLSSAGSTDAEDPTGLTYSWDFADGGSTVDSTEAEPSVRFSKPGRYPVKLTVTDPDGASDTDRVVVVVGQAFACESDRLKRVGDWDVRKDAEARGDRYCRGAAGSTLKMTFDGPRFDLFWGRGRGGGVGYVWVDGKSIGKVSFRFDSASPAFPYARTFKGLGEGRHTFELRVRDGAGFVDEVHLFR